MKRKPPTLHRRLPIDFGDEILCPVPVQSAVLGSSGRQSALMNSKFSTKLSNGECISTGLNGGRPAASPSPGGEGRGEGELKTNRLGANRLCPNSKLKIQNSKFRRRGFTLVELLVVLALLSLISFVLMAVFSTTQRAFRAGLTQTDSLESGRAVMDLIAADLETMTPSYDVSNYFIFNGITETTNAVNFSAFVNANFAFPPSPLIQGLVGSPDGALRTNILENIFILGKGNINGVPSWIATGYYVTNTLPDGTLYPLYRFYMTTNATSGARGANGLYLQFAGLQTTNNLIWSHLMDGVINLTAHAYDTNGVWVTNGYYGPVGAPINIPAQNVACFGTTYGEMNCLFFSNAVPASLQITLGTIEDRTLQHAEGLSGMNQSNFLANSAGQVHLFTRRVWIRNVDPTAYQ
jgi:prepilin-type N-terminal cleavage/methylation domain-containing protein